MSYYGQLVTEWHKEKPKKGEGSFMRIRTFVKSIVLALVVVSILMSPMSRSVMAATKLSADDFSAKLNNEAVDWNFFDDLEAAGEDEGVRGFGYDPAVDESMKGVVTTSRGINIGSKLSTVTKKYGKGTKGTLSDDISYKPVHDSGSTCLDNTDYVLTYKYVEYTDTDGKYTSRIHFYIENKKVSAIFYSRVFEKIK